MMHLLKHTAQLWPKKTLTIVVCIHMDPTCLERIWWGEGIPFLLHSMVKGRRRFLKLHTQADGGEEQC